MTVTDVHAHWMPESFAARVEAAAESDVDFGRRFASLLGRARPALTDITVLLREMDDAGVDMALVSVPPPASAVPGAESSRYLAAELNDALASTVSAYPSKLRAVLGLPLPDVDAACRELRRWTDYGQFAGIVLPVALGRTGIDADALEPLYRACAESNIPVFLHPALDEASAQLSQWSLHSAIGGPAATTTAVVRLALSGVLDRYPDLTFVAPHLGGLIPTLFGRLADQCTSPLARHQLTHYLSTRIYYDTCVFHPPALQCALETFGVSRFLLGTDYPFRGPISRATKELSEHLDAAANEAITKRNPQRLLTNRVIQSL